MPLQHQCNTTVGKEQFSIELRGLREEMEKRVRVKEEEIEKLKKGNKDLQRQFDRGMQVNMHTMTVSL
jgi:hypothetical protein